jgi:PTH1 family peptidyl-tRNA hydrolase
VLRGGRTGRTGTPADLLVVGLGNPGAEYERSRHNVGAETVALLAERHGEKLKKGKELALVAEVRIPAGGASKRVAIGWPQTYYTDSGLSVVKHVQRFGIDDWTRLVVVHDELDLPPGALRVKEGGGLAGNNGLRSIKAHLKTDEFVRIRIGVGKPPDPRRGADHVLKRPGKAERTELDIVVQEAADAVETILTDGISAAMTRFNRDRA